MKIKELLPLKAYSYILRLGPPSYQSFVLTFFYFMVIIFCESDNVKYLYKYEQS